ncbi:hypothetical protein ACMFMF_007729 [Clarireedia jacksonii]
MLARFITLASLLSGAGGSPQKILGDNELSPFTADFEQQVNKALAYWHVPGISIAVVDGDHEWSAGYGISHFPSKKVTPETLFYTGSTTKAFVAALTSLMVDNETLKWNTPISSIIRDDFVMEVDYATHHVTVEDALSHRTGLPRHDMSYGGTYDGRDGTIRDIVRSIRWLPMTEEMRTKFQYCNIMYIVMSYVIETLQGKWLGDLLYEHIWQPLGMESTYFSTSAAQDGPEDLAQGYDYYNHKYHEVPFMNLTLTSGAGSIVSNVLDYSKWLKALINKSAPLSKAGHNAIRTPRTIDVEPGTPFTGTLTYTLGWNFGVYHGHEFFMHEGGMEAFGALVIFFPGLKYGLVSFGNTGMTSNFVEETMVFHLIDEKLKVPQGNRFDWTKYREKNLQLQKCAYKNAVSRHYPNIPKPALPASLPIANYTGTYFHPAYRNATITFSNDVLKIDRSEQQLWKIAGEIKHISGDFFMAYVDSTMAPKSAFMGALPAEFRVDENGIAKSFGILVEGAMKEKIWFERVTNITVIFNGTIPGWGKGEFVGAVTFAVTEVGTDAADFHGAFGWGSSYPEYTISNASLTDMTSLVNLKGFININSKKASNVLYYVIQAYYVVQPLERELAAWSSNPKTIFQNGSVAIDHFSAVGAKVITDFMEDYVLLDGITELFQQEGKNLWEDSVEIPDATYWTPGLLEKFQAKYGFFCKSLGLQTWLANAWFLLNLLPTGIGSYNTTFDWNPLSSHSTAGAYLILPPVSDGVVGTLNGKNLPAFDITNPTVDIGSFLQTGKNVLELKVSSTLKNPLRPIWDSLETAGGGVASNWNTLTKLGFGLEQHYGLIGEVQIVPYVLISIL